jgi:hypothetical protein
VSSRLVVLSAAVYNAMAAETTAAGGGRGGTVTRVTATRGGVCLVNAARCVTV